MKMKTGQVMVTCMGRVLVWTWIGLDLLQWQILQLLERLADEPADVTLQGQAVGGERSHGKVGT